LRRASPFRGAGRGKVVATCRVPFQESSLPAPGNQNALKRGAHAAVLATGRRSFAKTPGQGKTSDLEPCDLEPHVAGAGQGSQTNLGLPLRRGPSLLALALATLWGWLGVLHRRDIGVCYRMASIHPGLPAWPGRNRSQADCPNLSCSHTVGERITPGPIGAARRRPGRVPVQGRPRNRDFTGWATTTHSVQRNRSRVGGAGCFLRIMRRGQSHFRGRTH